MQLSALITLALTSVAVLAAPSPLDLAEVPGLETRQSCTYETASYLSQCQKGDTLFCTGNTNVCQSGKTDTFDSSATKANEESCAGSEQGANCVQTIACC